MNPLDIITEPVELIRVLNAILALSAAVTFAVKINDDWHTLTNGWRVSSVALWGWPAVATYGSIEALYQQAQIGIRTPLVTAVAVTTLVGLWITRRQIPPPRARMIGAGAVLDVVSGVVAGEVHGPPCTHPGCLSARAELIRLATLPHPVEH